MPNTISNDFVASAYQTLPKVINDIGVVEISKTLKFGPSTHLVGSYILLAQILHALLINIKEENGWCHLYFKFLALQIIFQPELFWNNSNFF